jgi:membrane-associated phospholipid phosphatase
MSASFDGNDGNDGNTANAGGAGNTTSASTGWFFADRIDLPLVTEIDTGPNAPAQPVQIGQLPIINQPQFPPRNWSADWYAWLALDDFCGTPWQAINPTGPPPAGPPNWPWPLAVWPWPAFVPFPAPANWTGINAEAVITAEITQLVTAASDERADALADILSQSEEFISYFLNMMTARPGAYPATTKVLTIASLVGTFVAMYFKNMYSRPRPSQLCPALLPPIEVPGHASFPSGHSTQAHLMALCMNDVFNNLPQQKIMIDDLWTLADCIARNREIAGLHYPSDSAGGIAFAYWIHSLLDAATQTHYQQAVAAAQGEWQ